MKRTIAISSRGTRLFLRHSRIVVQRDDEVLTDIPVEDLGLVILESTGVSLSSGVLKAIGEGGGAILACDDSFHPCGMFLPIAANSLFSERARLQAETAAPLRKNLWTRIVRAKITNQALVLGPDLGAPLMRLADGTRSGDPAANESRAARIYWPLLFRGIDTIEQPFRRFREGPAPNNLLNYGYAVLRAATARALCAAGLQPAVGLHHRNRYSGFCLADDLMEPFRPIVDQVVVELVRRSNLSLDKESKQALIGFLGKSVLMSGEETSTWIALDRSASTLARAIEAQVKDRASAPNAAQLLQLPQVLDLCH